MSCSSLLLTIGAVPQTYNEPGQSIALTYNVTNLTCKKLEGCLQIVDNRGDPCYRVAMCPRETRTFVSSYIVSTADMVLSSIALSAVVIFDKKHRSNVAQVTLVNSSYLGPTGPTGPTAEDSIFGSFLILMGDFILGQKAEFETLSSRGITSATGPQIIVDDHAPDGIYEIDVCMNYSAPEPTDALMYVNIIEPGTGRSISLYPGIPATIAILVQGGTTITIQSTFDGSLSTLPSLKFSSNEYAGYLNIRRIAGLSF